MRKLHLVGFTPDRKGLIFSARRGSKSGGFLVPLEDSLLESLAAEQRRRNGVDTDEGVPASTETKAKTEAKASPPAPAGRPQSTLTPREMQSRLRAGRTIAEVAAEAGVSTDWVERFAIPILAEQAQMVELARSLTYSRLRGGESALPLGSSVAENLADRGVVLPEDVFDNAWSAYQLHDAVWIVRIRYRSRGRLQEAGWEVDVTSGHLTARNRLASELAYVEKGRRRRARQSPSSVLSESAPVPPARPSSGRPSAARSRPAKKATATGRARARGGAASAPVAGPQPTAGGGPADQSSTPAAAKRRTASKRTAAKRTPAKRPAAKRTSPTRQAAKRPTAKRPVVKRAGAKAVARPQASAGGTGRRAKVAPSPTRAPARRTAPSSAKPTTAPRSVEVPTPANPVSPRPRVGTDGTPPSPSSGRVGSPASAGPAAHERQDGPPHGPAGARAPVNRLAASRITASRIAAGRLKGDRRPANPVPSGDPLAPPPSPSRPRAAQARPTDGGRAAMASPPPPAAPPPAAAPPPPARAIPLPAATPAAMSRAQEAASPAQEAVPSPPEAVSPAPVEEAPGPAEPPSSDTDFEIDDLLEPAPRADSRRPVIAAERAGRPIPARPIRRAAGSGRLSPSPLGTI